MTIVCNASIPTSGLIASIDAGNLRSLAGVGEERLGEAFPSFNNWNGLVGTSTSYTGKNGRPAIFLSITNNNGGGVNYWNANKGTTACVSSAPYIITAKVKWARNTPNPNLFYVRQYNSGGAQTTESGKFNSSNILDLGDGFYYTWAYFTTDATATSFLVQGYDYSNIDIWIEEVQCRRAGLADMIGQTYNATMAGSMSWTPSFGGALSYSAGASLSINNLNLASGAFTVISAARYNGGTRGRIVNAINNNWLIGHWSNSVSNYYAEGWVSGVGVGGTDTNWRIHAATGNTSNDTWSLYINGELNVSSNANGSAGPNGIGIGTNGEYSDAQFSFVYVYNRVLTAEEIFSVFAAERSRFNL